MTRHILGLAVFFLVAPWTGPAHAKTFEVGAVTLGAGETARLHVVNSEGGSVTVELRFTAAGTNTLLASQSATLGPGQVQTLDITGAPVAGGFIIVATVIATDSVSPSTCKPTVTLQVMDPKGRNTNSLIFATGTVVRKGLDTREIGATYALRTLAQAQQQFFASSDSRTGGRRYAASIEELQQAKLLPEGFSVAGYQFRFRLGLYIYRIVAEADEVYRRTGVRSFYVDETGILLGEDVTGSTGSCQDAMPEI